MAESKLPPRPRQITLAAGIGLASSVFLVLSLFDALTRIRSSQVRSSVNDFLSRPPGDGLGITYEDVASVLRAVVFLNGALAATAAVLSVYILQRHQGARVGFSAAAVLLLVSSPVTGTPMAILVAFAATLLWGRPSRDWFAGREPTTATPARRDDAADRTAFWSGDSERWSPPDTTSVPDREPLDRVDDGVNPAAPQPGPASYPFGQAPQPGWAPPAHGEQPSPGPTGAVGPRPPTVTAAAWVTWVCSALVLMLFLGMVLTLVVAQDFVVEAIQGSPQFADNPYPTQDVLAALWVLTAICLTWALAAMALAFLAYRRVGWARVTLVVSAAVTAALGVLAWPGGLLLSAVAVLTVVLLFTGSARRWYAARENQVQWFVPPSGPNAGPPPSPPPPQHGNQATPPEPQEKPRRQVW